MILGFNKRFIDPILSGHKIHTLRLDRCNRWKAGNIIHFAVNVRTKRQSQFEELKCTGTQTIKIEYRGRDPKKYAPHITIDGKELDTAGIQLLARKDGFDKDFEGKIIHWTHFRY